jgi:hypothetical protein
VEAIKNFHELSLQAESCGRTGGERPRMRDAASFQCF